MSSYFAPYIDSTGFHMPNYSDILEYLLSSFKSIYGQDCYLGNDSADYQYISIFAKAIYDNCLVAQQSYNNRVVTTATGVSLDGLVRINGITRKSASYSTCTVKLTGVVGTEITDGVVQDLSGYYWDIPGTYTIPIGGEINASAICRTIGSISALPDSITIISSTQKGWTSVNNEVSAVEGLPVETDAELRSRQALSTALASHTTIAATEAAIAAVENVTRYNIHENYTNITDEFSCPEHSITCVVEGGVDEDVAMAIYLNKGIGCYTNGTTTITVTDPDTEQTLDIKFSRPSAVDIYVDAVVTPFEGYTSIITDQIEEAILDYLNSLQIGQDLTTSALYAAVMAVTPDITNPLFSVVITTGLTPSPTDTDDITILYNQVTQGVAGKINVEVVS